MADAGGRFWVFSAAEVPAIPMAELFRRGLRLGPPGSEQVRGGVRQIQFRRGTKNSAAESAADSADCCGTNGNITRGTIPRRTPPGSA